MNAPTARLNLVKLAVPAILIIIVWSLVVSALPRGGKPVAASQWGANHITAERWLLGEGASCVLVGSSMSARLSASGLGPNTVNLGMQGIQALDALAIARAHRQPPRTVVIETNFLYWRALPDFVDGTTSPVRQTMVRHLPVFRTENQPLNLLLRGMRGKSAGGDAGVGKIDETIREAEVGRQLIEMAEPPPPATWLPALARLDAAVKAMTADGTEVRFLEMPMDARLAASPRQVAAREEILRRYPADRWSWLRLDQQGPWATSDGIHLMADGPEAARAAALIAAWLSDPASVRTQN